MTSKGKSTVSDQTRFPDVLIALLSQFDSIANFGPCKNTSMTKRETHTRFFRSWYQFFYSQQ